jgi:hypothetical protein
MLSTVTGYLGDAPRWSRNTLTGTGHPESGAGKIACLLGRPTLAIA